MTAWQDLPPRTRRQARMDERMEPAPQLAHAPKEHENTSPPAGEGYSADRDELTSAYSRRSRRAADASDETSDFRVRDFRPASADPAVAGPEVDGRLTYRTQARPLAQSAQPQPVVDSVPLQFAAPPRPMTRRELRELEVRQGTRP